MITSQDKNNSEAIKKAKTFQEHNNNKIIEEEKDDEVEISEKFKKKISKIDKKLEHKNDGLKKAQTFKENQKLTLNEIEQNKTTEKGKKKNNKQQKKVTFKDIENEKGEFVDTIKVNSYKNDNRIATKFLTEKAIKTQASIFVKEIEKKNDNLNVFEGFSINKQALIENKPKIGFWEGIFCCCRKDIIEKRSLNAVIDRIVNRNHNKDNILLNTEEINAINRDIQTYMRD